MIIFCILLSKLFNKLPNTMNSCVKMFSKTYFYYLMYTSNSDNFIITWVESLDIEFSLFLNGRFVLFLFFAYFDSFHFSVPWSNKQFHSFSHLIREETALSLIKTTALKSLDNKVKIGLVREKGLGRWL